MGMGNGHDDVKGGAAIRLITGHSGARNCAGLPAEVEFRVPLPQSYPVGDSNELVTLNAPNEADSSRGNRCRSDLTQKGGVAARYLTALHLLQQCLQFEHSNLLQLQQCLLG